MSLLLVNTATLWACSAIGWENPVRTFRPGFELCVVVRDANEDKVAPAIVRNGQSLLVQLPALLSSSDLKRVRAVTKSSWYLLSGNHRSSTLLLQLKAAAVVSFRAALDRVISRGDRIAILLNGEGVGVLMFNHPLTEDEIAIDASFFSDGTQKEKEAATHDLAERIKSTLY